MTLQKLAQYGKAFQHKVIGTLLTDKEFLLTVRDVLRDEYFDSESQKWIIQHIVHYFDKYHTIPTPEVFKVELQKLENEVLEVAIKAELRNCYEATQEDSEYVKSEFLAFAKNQELKAALLASADLLNSGDYDGIRSVIDRAMKAGVDKNIGHEYKKDVESRYREDYRPTVATPWPTISDAIQGGWGPGDLIIIFGGPGSGKCIDRDTELKIRYREYRVFLTNSAGKPFSLQFKPWEEFNFDGTHMYGWEIANTLQISETFEELNKNTSFIQTTTVTIGDLFFNLGIEPVENNHYPVEFFLEIETPHGFQPIDALFTTEKQDRITTVLRNGKKITTSPDHQLFTASGDWKKVRDLTKEDTIQTATGIFGIRNMYKEKARGVLYDLTVRDVHCYYANGILSHNSWTMVAAAAHAVKLGYNVNYYTLELGEDYVGKRFDANITGLDTEGLKKGRSKVEKTLKSLTGNLIIKEYPPKSASINTIKAHIQKCTDMGMKPDMVIIDYVDYLKSPSKVKYLERKDEIDDVFISAKALAKELKIPILTPSQVNRGGAKDDVIEGDKAAGSYDKIMVADICLSLSRKKEDKVLGTGRLHLMKSRYGNDGLTWDVQLDTATGTMSVLGESQAGGGTSPGGSKSYKDVASKFFSLENSK